MPTSSPFSYFHGITGKQFRHLSTDAKLLYGLLLDRMGLSARNGWYDELGRVYIYYPLEEIQEAMNCGHEKAVKLLAELDTGKGIGLIERVKQGQGKPARKVFWRSPMDLVNLLGTGTLVGRSGGLCLYGEYDHFLFCPAVF